MYFLVFFYEASFTVKDEVKGLITRSRSSRPSGELRTCLYPLTDRYFFDQTLRRALTGGMRISGVPSTRAEEESPRRASRKTE